MEKYRLQEIQCRLGSDTNGLIIPQQQQRQIPIINNNREDKNRKQKNKSKFTGSRFLNELYSTKNKKRSLCWSPVEDKIIFNKYMEIGSKWIQISPFLHNRTDNDVKNRFYCCLRKVQYHVNTAQKRNRIKSDKLFSFNSLLTILEIGKIDSEISDKRFGHIKNNLPQFMQARKLIVELAQVENEEQSSMKIERLLKMLIDLKYALKFINSQRVKKSTQKKSISVIGSNEEQLKKSAQYEPAEQSTKRETIKNSNNITYEINNNDLEDVQQIYDRLHNRQNTDNLSLIETCKDVLCFNIVSKQINDHLFII